MDPRIAALRDQERKFAKLTERYRQALAQRDPAALALLERVCLFRLGAEAKTLASVFTGVGKENISGPVLAALTVQQLQAKLQLLVEMRLLEASKPLIPNQIHQGFTVHPAVRDGFLRELDTESARLGHDAARIGLESSLGRQPSTKPSDPATLDLLEEIVYHTLAAGHAEEAWDIYCNRIGGFINLGWRLGAFARGERICRAFVDGRLTQTAPLPVTLSEDSRALFLNEWALYLKSLGQLAAATHCYLSTIEFRIRQESWGQASMCNQNLASTLLSAGRLSAALRVAEEALRLAVRKVEKHNSYGYRARALSLVGDLKGALADFKMILELREIFVIDDEASLFGDWQSTMYHSLGRMGQASDTASQTLKSLEFHHRSNLIQNIILLRAGLACDSDSIENARSLSREAHGWALQHDQKEQLCWAELVRAKVELSAFSNQTEEARARASRARAILALEGGLRISRECGFGIFHIDLLLVRAQLALLEGRAADSERDIRITLDEGVHPPSDSGFPELLAATDPECLYAWGIAEGRHLLGEALLLQAAQKLGQAEFVPRRLDRLPVEVRGLIDRAREQLGEALDLWRKLRDPESEADINPRGERTRRVIEQLDSGVLTEYPLEPTFQEEPAELSESSAPGKAIKESKAVPKQHVFLSYCRDNKTEVAKLHDELIAAGEAVWWDQDILPGQDWKLEIRKAMKNAYAVVLCLSQETAARTTSGIYPEALDAVAAYREYSPGSTFLIPVRLSDCEVPPIEIDGTRTLDRLQFVDLFPPPQRASGFARLVTALQAAPHHP